MSRNLLRLTLLAVAVSGALPLLIIASSGQLVRLRTGEAGSDSVIGFLSDNVPSLAGSLLLCAVLWFVYRALCNSLEAVSVQQAEYLDKLSDRSLPIAIFVSAGLSLFIELSIIRWHMSALPLLTFYKNFSLISCFAGLGLGYALSRRDQIPLIAVPPMLCWQFAILLFLRYGLGDAHGFALRATPVFEEVQTNLITARTTLHYVSLLSTLGFVFAITSLTLIPVGQLCGRVMSRTTNLRAYGLNLAGSIAGVVLMHLMSYLWTPPAVWFAVALCILIAFLRFSTGALLFSAMTCLLALLVLSWPVSSTRQLLYSPYQPLERRYTEDGLTSIYVGDRFYQHVFDLSPENLAGRDDPELLETAQYYELPYRYHENPKSVLIVGAGTGNDVAAALRMGCTKVDAVEIDPVILEIGKAAHPERPYQSSFVTAIEDDARSFFRNNDEVYDLVVYGLLDSQSILSQMSTVRLDSFVYTVEGLRDARSRLNDTGLLSLSFAYLSTELGQKIFLMLTEAFDGQEPLWISTPHGYVYLESNSGEMLYERSGGNNNFEIISPEEATGPQVQLDLSTDNWPFFYMPRRVFPVTFLPMMALIVAITVVLLVALSPGRPKGNMVGFFLLGTGFMLIETKGITELALQFGNTWQVIGILIIGILGMSFLANLVVAATNIQKTTFSFVLLVGALILGYLIARTGGTSSDMAGRMQALILLTLPVFFSGIAFSSALRFQPSIGGVMGANLLGSICGGFLEYSAMKFGYQSLYLLAIVIYIAAAFSFIYKPGADSGSFTPD